MPSAGRRASSSLAARRFCNSTGTLVNPGGAISGQRQHRLQRHNGQSEALTPTLQGNQKAKRPVAIPAIDLEVAVQG